MVCKRIKRVLSMILLTVFIFMVFFVSVSATTGENTEDETEKQELIALAKDAHCMYLMLAGEYRNFKYCAPDVKEFILQNGYAELPLQTYPCPIITGKWEDGKPVETYTGYAYAAKMDSIETWKAEIEKYFTKDLFGFTTGIRGIPELTDVLYEHDGRTYAHDLSLSNELVMHWDETNILFLSEEKAEATFHWNLLGDERILGTSTMQMQKTERGWRVCGGNHFDYFRGSAMPETGDNTPVFLTLTALSVLGICALAVTVKRKEKQT